MSDLWRATTPDAVNISDNFSHREFTDALQHLKPAKAPGPDSIGSEFILHAGAGLKSWLRDFLCSCLRRLKIPFFHAFHSSMHKWGLALSPNCECDAFEQTADHVLTACPIHRAPHRARGLTVLDDETRCWFNNTTASI